jgi:hypothetical protein
VGRDRLLAFQRDKLTFQPQVIITALHLDKVNLISWLISKIINHSELRCQALLPQRTFSLEKSAERNSFHLLVLGLFQQLPVDK